MEKSIMFLLKLIFLQIIGYSKVSPTDQTLYYT